MLFDTHAHMDDHAYDEDRQQLLSDLPGLGLALVMNPGCSAESSRKLSTDKIPVRLNSFRSVRIALCFFSSIYLTSFR